MSKANNPEPAVDTAQTHMPAKNELIRKAQKLEHVCYDIRGPALTQARRLEEEGFKVIKLNSGNVGLFNFDAPDELIQDIIKNIRLLLVSIVSSVFCYNSFLCHCSLLLEL